MTAVFLVQYSHHLPKDDESVFIIGIYSSEAQARAAVERTRRLPGFREPAGDFSIDGYELDQDHWTEGFVTV